MDEFQPMLHTEETPAAGQPREVVLRYEPLRPQPVVERYIQPEPLPGSRGAEPSRTEPPVPDAARYVFTPPENAPPYKPGLGAPERGGSRTGLRIFLICLAVLLVAMAALGALAWQRARERERERQFTFRYEFEPHGEREDYSDAETSIERYPNGGGTRLRYEGLHGDELSIQSVYELVNPCTVTVATALPDGSAIIGTGVIFTADGYILTNAHVITGGTQCYVVRDTGVSYDAMLVGCDAEKDLAVIKIDARNLPTAEFGDSDALTVGDTVYAIGNPLGVELRGTLTDGIVSAINRDVMVDGVNMTLIQTNAALNNGNSGGPLINVYGQVVGINTMKMGSTSAVSVEGLGFAIPISSAAWMVDDLIAYGEIHGEPVLGISVEHLPVTLDGERTALRIGEVVPDGPGEKAGLQVGDLITQADGEPVASVSDLLRARRRYGTGDALTLEIERDGERFTVNVVLEEAADP